MESNNLHPRVSSLNVSSPDMYHRPYPSIRTPTNYSPTDTNGRRVSPLSLSPILSNELGPNFTLNSPGNGPSQDSGPTVFGMPLKYVS